MSKNTIEKVGILGSGISGLTYAYYLSKLNPKIQIDIFERSKRSGGFINSAEAKEAKTQDGIIFEKGPRTLRGASEGTLLILDLLDKFKALDKLKGINSRSIANKKYLLEPHSNVDSSVGTLIELPSSTGSLLSFLSDPVCKYLILGLLKEPFVSGKKNNKEESVEEWFTRRFNKQVCDNFVSAMIHGIYAGDVKKLSMDLVFPRLVEIEKEKGSIVRYMISKTIQNYQEKRQIKKKKGATEKPVDVGDTVKKYKKIIGSEFNFSNVMKYLNKFPMLTLQGGLQTLPNLIRENLPSNVRIHYGSEITKLSSRDNGKKVAISCDNDKEYEFDHLRSTINLHDFGRLIGNPGLVQKVEQVEYINMITCNVYIPNHNRLSSNPGFGYLVPNGMTNRDWKLLGVIFDSDVEKNAVNPLYYHHLLKDLKNEKKVMTSQDVKEDSAEVVRLEQFESKKASSASKDYTKLTVMIGGYMLKDSDLPVSNSRIHNVVREVLAKTLKIDIDDESGVLMETDVNEHCIPQFHIGYKDLLQDIRNDLSSQFGSSVSIGGMVDGIGVPDCVLGSFKASIDLTQSYN